MKLFRRRNPGRSEPAPTTGEATGVDGPGPELVDADDGQPASAGTVDDNVGELAPPAAGASGDGASASPNGEGFFARLRRGLGRTSSQLAEGVGTLFLGRKEIDAELLEDLESQLLLADVGVEATMDISARLAQRVSRRELTEPAALQRALQEELLALLQPCEGALDIGGRAPFVMLMVGVNGVGKTTTIGKLAKYYQACGHSVMLAAGDTFRAAAVEQLQVPTVPR